MTQPFLRAQSPTYPNNLEAETAVLGSILISPHALDEVQSVIEPTDFYLPVNGEIYRAMTQVRALGMEPDVITLSDYLERAGSLERCGGVAHLVSLGLIVPTSINAAYYAQIVLERALERQALEKANTLQDRVLGGERLADVVSETMVALRALLDRQVSPSYHRWDEVAQEYWDSLGELMAGAQRGLPTGYIDLDKLTGGMHRQELIVLGGRPSSGKAQPLDAAVLTLTGWKDMGAIRIGDRLASVDGGESVVVGVHPQGEKQIYRVMFSDGRSCECCGDHLWRVHHRKWPIPKVLTTDEVSTLLGRPAMRKRLWVEQFTGEYGVSSSLPIDPWVLGVYLGDGHSCNMPRFTNPDKDITDRISRTLGGEYQLTTRNDLEFSVRRTAPRWEKGRRGPIPNGFKQQLEELGLHGKRSWEKFIPTQYLSADKETRLEVLRGLIDSDGWVEKSGEMCYSTSSPQLALDVQTLARSVGGVCRIVAKERFHTYLGERREGRTAYSISISHPDKTSLVTLSRKRDRLRSSLRLMRSSFVSITPTRRALAQCITVSHPSGLYVTDDFIVTHNSSFVLNIAHRVASAGHRVYLHSLEMSREICNRRLLTLESGIEFEKIRDGTLTPEEQDRLALAVERASDRQIYIDDSSGLTIATIRSRLRRERPDLLIVDYLGFLKGEGEKRQNRIQELDEITIDLKELAKEMDIPVLVPSQLSREVEKRADHRPLSSDLSNSGAIEANADQIWLLYRELFYDPETLRPFVEDLEVSKHRNGHRGTVHFFVKDDLMKFLDISPGSSPTTSQPELVPVSELAESMPF